MDDKFQVDDRVILTHSSYLNLHGTLRYKGTIEGTVGIWLGVDLDEAKGKNSGDHKEVFYFRCEPKHGVFVRATNLRLESEGELIDVSKLPENESPTKPQEKPVEKPAEKQTNEPLIKLEKPTLDKPAQKTSVPEEKKSAATKTVEKSKATEEKPQKLAEKEKAPEKKLVKEKETKDVKAGIKKAGTVKETVVAVKRLGEKKTTTTTTTGEKKGPTTSATTGKKTATVKKTGVETAAGKKVGKIQEEDSKSVDSKDEVTEENEEETVESRPEETKEEAEENLKTEITQFENDEGGLEEVKALRVEVDEKTNELIQKDAQIKELTKNISELAKKIKEYEKEKEKVTNSADFENLNNLKLMQVEQKLKESERKNKHLESDFSRLKKEFELQKDHLQQHESFTHMVEGLTIENESLKANIEALTMELDESKAEIKKLKDENEMIQLEIEEAMEVPKVSEDSSNDDIEKIKENNGKLRLAIQILNEKYENEQIFHLEQIERYKLALERIPELQNKVKELDETKQMLGLKDLEIEELKNRLDEGSEYQEMIEMLTNDLMKKEEDIIDLKRMIKDLKEERDVNNQLIEATEDENKELNRVIESRDLEIIALANKIKDRDDALEDREKYINKYKEKLEQIKKELEMYKDNAQKTGGEESRNMKRIEELLQKQLEILSEKREIYKKMINFNVINLKLSNEVLTCNTFLKTLPSIFLEKLHLDAFNKFTLVRTLKGKTKFLMEELQESYIKPQQAKENIDLVNWLSKGLLYLNNTLFCLDNIELAMIFLNSEEEYLEFSKNSLFGTCTAIQVIIDSMLRTHREEAMSVKIPIEPLKILSTKLLEQTNAIAKKYMDREGQEENNKEQSQLKKFLKIAQVLYLNKSELMKAKIYTENIWFTCINRDYNQEKFEKSALKINDSLEKTQKKIVMFLQIKNKQDGLIAISRSAVDKILGENVFNEEEEAEITNILSVLVEYYDKILDEFISDKENFHLRVKDIFDKLDSLCGRLIITVPTIKRFSLSNDGNLVYDPMASENDTGDEFQGASSNSRVFGPWDLSSQNMNDELKKVLENVENFEKMNVELKEQLKKLLRLEEELKAVNLVKESLEIRVADLQIKAERVAILEKDKRRLQEREQHFNEATEAIKNELENAEQRNRELEEEIAEMRSGTNVANLPPESESQSIGFGRKSVFKSASRETLMPYSRLSVMGQPQQMVGERMGGMVGVNITGNVAPVENVDSFECYDIIQRLLAENCYLKSGEIRERLQKLKDSMPKFSKYFQEVKMMNATGSLQNTLINLTNKLNTVQKKAQKKLAEAKIIDLEKIGDLSIVEKNENAIKFISTYKKPLETLKAEAYGVSYNLYQNFKAEIDEHKFQTHLDSGLQEALRTVKNGKYVAGMEFVKGCDPLQKENAKTQKLTLTTKEYLEFTRKIILI